MICDKRIIKTRTSIKNAFMLIALEKELNKITISDIAESALINRSTFYLHYSDVKAVIDDIEAETSNTIYNCLEKFDISSLYESTYLLFCSLSAEFERDVLFKKYILYSKNSASAVDRLKQIFTEKLFTAYLEFYPNRNLPLTAYKVNFVAAGIIDTYVKWSRDENACVKLEELCKTFSQIIEFMITNK